MSDMQGIDISNWDEGLDLSDIAFDFVICKITEGKDFTDKLCGEFVSQATALGKPWGVYHYVDGSGVDAEARHFIDTVRDYGYLGKGILVLDWESYGNDAWQDESYLESLIEMVKARSGITPMIYASKSVFPWDVCARQGCATWVAQYANEDLTGYQDSPWNEGAYDCDIRQYASTGRLAGFGGNLDLDKAYITADDWARLAGVQSQAPTVEQPQGSTVLQMAMEVIQGKYGNGETRRAALGNLYDQVQAKVNDIYAKADKCINGDYGNGEARKAALGIEYDIVQNVVNMILA